MGIYFRNTNAASPIITHKNNTEATISYITTGGHIEIYFFLKDTAKGIIKAYQQFIGKPSLPPFWALGWHVSTTSNPNTTLNDVKGIVGNYSQIPLEAIWLDTSYMSKSFKEDFAVDNTAFADFKNYTETVIHKQDKKLVLAINAGLKSVSKENKYFSDAL